MTQLATEIRDRLGPVPERRTWPTISIVVVNRDGVAHLRRLLAGLVERTDYPRLELIVVDNASSDGSLETIRSVEAPFPISILANPHNESFSDANNMGAELASGELLLFLNNDTEPFEPGWLRELVACSSATQAGAVSATLLFPDGDGNSPSGYGVQTQPPKFHGTWDSLEADASGNRLELFDGRFGADVDSPSLIGACLLFPSELFHQVGGFTRGYFYGAEDDDICLKLRERGLSVLYSGRSFLIHHFGGTSRRMLGEGGSPIRRANVSLIGRRWGPRLWREYHLDRLAGGGLWAEPDGEESPGLPSLDEVLAPGFCLKADGLAEEGRRAVGALAAELERRGHRCLALLDDSIDDPRSLLFDAIVHLRGPNRYIPHAGRLNVLWLLGDSAAVSAIECRRYDLAVTNDAEQAERLREGSRPTPVVALDGDRAAAALIEAALARAEQIDLPMRIQPGEILAG